MNKMKYIIALFTSAICLALVHTAFAVEPTDKDFKKEGFATVAVINNTGYAFNVKLSDKSNPNPSTGPGTHVAKNGGKADIVAPRQGENLAIEGSKFWIQIDADTISAGKPHKIMEDTFRWNSMMGRPIGHTFILKKGMTGKDEVGVKVTYSMEGGKAKITLDKE
jgi:hypothetical protein